MLPALAIVIIIFVIAGLFWLDRDPRGSTSKGQEPNQWRVHEGVV